MGLAKTHFLENCDLPTLLEPAPAHAVQVTRAFSALPMLPIHRQACKARALRCDTGVIVVFISAPRVCMPCTVSSAPL